MRNLLLAIAVAGAALGTSAMIGAAQAMPVNASDAVLSAAGDAGAVEQVAQICNRHRCWWTPGRYHGRGFYGRHHWGHGHWGHHRG